MNIDLLGHVLLLQIAIYHHMIVLRWLAQSDLEFLLVKTIHFFTYGRLCIFALKVQLLTREGINDWYVKIFSTFI